MATSVFRLPRKPMAPINPRRISKQVQEDVAPKRALDVWKEGFSTEKGDSWFEDLGTVFSYGAPDNEARLPEDVTILTSEELGRLHGLFAAWSIFFGTRVAHAKIDLSEQKAYTAHVLAEVRLKKAGTVQDKTAKAQNDETFIQAEMRQLELEAKYELLKARMEGFREGRDALSRELSRRQGDREASGG